MASFVSEKQKSRSSDTDRQHQAAFFNYFDDPVKTVTTDRSHDESHDAESSSVDSTSPREAAAAAAKSGHDWDEVHIAESSFSSSLSGRSSQDDGGPPVQLMTSLQHFGSSASSSGNRGHASVDQAVKMSLLQRDGPAGAASRKIRYSAADTNDRDALQDSDEMCTIRRISSAYKSGKRSSIYQDKSRSHGEDFDENGNPYRSIRSGLSLHSASATKGDSSSGHDPAYGLERDDHVRGESSEAGSARQTYRRKKGGKGKKVKNSFNSDDVDGYVGRQPLEDVLSYINGSKMPADGSKMPVDVIGVVDANGDDKLKKKAKKLRAKRKKPSHSATNAKERPSSGQTSSSTVDSAAGHCTETDADTHGDRSALAPSTADCGLPSFVKSSNYSDDRGVDVDESTPCSNVVTLAVLDNPDVNVSSTVTTFETFSVDLVAEVPPSHALDCEVPSLIGDHSAVAVEAFQRFADEKSSWSGGRTLSHSEPPNESFLMVGRKKKSKDLPNVKVPTGGTRQAISYYQTGYRPYQNGSCSASAFGANAAHSGDYVLRTARLRDPATDSRSGKRIHDSQPSGKGTAGLLNDSDPTPTDFPSVKLAASRDVCHGTEGACRSGAASHAAAAAINDSCGHMQTWAAVASKPVTPASCTDRSVAELEPSGKCQQSATVATDHRHPNGRHEHVALAGFVPAPCLPHAASADRLAAACSVITALDPSEPKARGSAPGSTAASCGSVAAVANDSLFCQDSEMPTSQPPSGVPASSVASKGPCGRPLRGVEFCGSILHSVPAPIAISFGIGDGMDDDEDDTDPWLDAALCKETVQQAHVSGSASVSVPCPVVCSAFVAADAPAAGTVAAAAASPMAEAQIRATQTCAAPAHDDVCHARLVQFLSREFAAVLELQQKSPGRVFVYSGQHPLPENRSSI